MFLSASLAVFWSAFKPIKDSFSFPFALLIALSANFTYMMSYQHAPICMLVMGFGLLFHALKKQNNWLCILSSITLAYGATTNISIFPTVLTTGLFISILVSSSPIKRTFHLSYWFTSVLFISASIISRLSFFQINKDPRFGTVVLLAKIPHFLWFLISTNPIVVAFIAVMIFTSLRRSTKEKLFLSILALMFIYLTVHSYIEHTRHHGPQRDIINSGVFYSYFVAMIYVLYFRFDEFFLRITAFLVALVSYMSILSIATLGDFASHMSFVAPASVLVGCLIFEQYSDSTITKKYFMVLMSLLTLMSMVFFARYTFRSYPLLDNKVVMTHSRMLGVVEDPAKVAMLNKIEDIYYKNNCDNKLFVAYPSLPFLYYYFHREAPLHQPWLSDSVGYVTTDQMVKTLRNNVHWCVVTAPEFNNAPKNYFTKVTTYLERNKRKSYKVAGSDVRNINMPKLAHIYIK